MFEEKLQDCKHKTEARLRHRFANIPESSIKDAISYAVLNGGKRLRAFLVLESSSIFDIDPVAAEHVAAAVECLHAYSLVHDDLPSMDNDCLRRGLPTVHVKWDEATAILAGDALQSLSFEFLSAEDLFLNPIVKLNLINTLAESSGMNGMVLGQMQDMLFEERQDHVSIDEISVMQNNKTGKLIQWSAKSGAVMAQKRDSALESYSDSLGLAFQITDDILDIEGLSDELGKTPRKDLIAGKATFVSLMGLDQAKYEVKELISKACDALGEYGSKAEGLRELAKYIGSRKK